MRKETLLFILITLFSSNITSVYAKYPSSTIETKTGEKIHLAFNNLYPESNNTLTIIQFTVPENLQYLSYNATNNQTNITDKVTESRENNTIILKNEISNNQKNNLTITITLQTGSEPETTTITWRTIYTHFTEPTSPPIIQDKQGKTIINITQPEETKKSPLELDVSPLYAVTALTVFYIITKRRIN